MNDLNDPKIRPLTVEVAASLGLEQAFVAFLFAASRPACFDYWVESPERGWTSRVPSNVDVAYPLWCTNGDQMLLCEGQGRRWFRQGYHDGDEARDVAKSVQGLLADLFFRMSDSESAEEDLRAAATSGGFRYFEKVDAAAWNERHTVVKAIDEQE
jgi:hypothetical protein